MSSIRHIFTFLSVQRRGKVTVVSMVTMWSTSGGAVLRVHPSDARDVSWSQRVTWRVSGPTFLGCGEVTRGGGCHVTPPQLSVEARQWVSPLSLCVCACVERGEAGWSWCRSRAVRWAEEEIDAEADWSDDAPLTCLFTLSVLCAPRWKNLADSYISVYIEKKTNSSERWRALKRCLWEKAKVRM